MRLNYKRPLGPISSSQATEFETELGFILPEDYKQFLTTIGGGYAPDRGLAYPKTWLPGVVIQSIYAPQSDDYCDIRQTRESTGDYIPSCFLHFACDPNGQFFVIDMRPESEHYGKIYVRDHDHARNAKPFLTTAFFEKYDCDPDEHDLYHFIAGSLTEFLDMLKTDEEIDAQ